MTKRFGQYWKISSLNKFVTRGDRIQFMEKRALQLANVASMIDQFNMSNIEILQSLGYTVDVVADFTNPGLMSKDKVERLKKQLEERAVRAIDVAVPRSLNPKNIICAYRRIKQIIDKGHYQLIHCHSPIGGVLCRQAAKKERKKGCRLIYTAHGFHFYDGAPLINWLLYYPIEKHYSRYTDILITINNEDYKRAANEFYARKTLKIPGVGVDTEKFFNCKVDIKTKREELGIEPEDFVLLSVGELSERKNQQVVLDALAELNRQGAIENIVYLIVGIGEMQDKFNNWIREYGLSKHVRLLGFRTDIDEICKIADCFIHPSIREGLGIAPLEAMSTGLPLISANVNGIKDYTEEGISGCCVDPKSVKDMVSAIRKMHDDKGFRERSSLNNIRTAQAFDIHRTNEIMRRIYNGNYLEYDE